MHITSRIARHAAQAGVRAALVPLILGTALAADPVPSAAGAAAPKATHVLFMGADIALEKDKEYHPVEDVTATAIVIKPGGQRVEVPLSQGRDLRINESLKLAETSVGVTDLKTERVFTFGADPFNKLARMETLAAGESAVADLARGEVNQAQYMVMGAAAGVIARTGSPAEADARAVLEAAQVRQAGAEDNLQRTISLPGIDMASQTVAAGNETSQQMFDAIRISFDVSAEKNLAQPYFAVIALIRERDSKPGQVRKWAYVKSLGPMSAGVPKGVSVFRGGLPPGYLLEGCEVHVYNQGEEVATNLSRKRVPLTDEEVLDYRMIEYIGANKGRTLPAVPAGAQLPSGWRERLTSDQLSATCYAFVGKDGNVRQVFTDAAGKHAVQDPELGAAVRAVRFKPALLKGTPVEQITPVTLGELAR